MADAVLFRRGTGQVGTAGWERERGRERGLAMALKGVWPPQSDDSDIWDDTALIKAYDKAVASFKVRGSALLWPDPGAEAAGLAFIGFLLSLPKECLKEWGVLGAFRQAGAAPGDKEKKP